jgi:tricarballylate dehydrogenase
LTTPSESTTSRDVVVIGGGNAALCAALTALRGGRRVLLVERAPEDLRGGNTRHTRNIRHIHDGPDEVMTGHYREEELWRDLVKVSGDEINEPLARQMIRESADCPAFMTANGIRWQPSLRGTLHLSRTNRFFLGGGKALVNSYYATAIGLGLEVRYATTVVELEFDGPRCRGIVVESGGRRERIEANAYVIASGGFEANLGWLGEYWGDAAEGFIIRGGPFNDGIVLRRLLEAGASPIGDPRGFHAVAVDARAPRFDGGIVTRIDSLPFSVTVNRDGVRFADEGEDLWPRRYASWGGLIARQPGQVAVSIFDARSRGKFIPGVFPPLEAGSIRDLAGIVGLPVEQVVRTIDEYNAAAPDDGDADFSELDGRSTTGLRPAKSNWAQRIDRPPFYAYPLRPGITFTYLGVQVDAEARICLADGGTTINVVAAGEIMAGNILTRGYLAGVGLTIGTVFGRLAGTTVVRDVAA